MNVENRDLNPNKHPDPKLIELIKSGSLVPLFRAYGKNELDPQINIIAAYILNPESAEIIKEVKIVSFPLEELNIAENFLHNMEMSQMARELVNRFFRGARTNTTVRHMADPDQMGDLNF